MAKVLSFLLIVLWTVSNAPAAPLVGEQIDSDAKWIIHVDMEAFRDSASGEIMQQKWSTRDDVRRHLSRVREATGIDLSQDVLSLTLYDTQFKKHHGVAMVRVRSVDGQRLLDHLNEKEPDNRMVQYGAHRLYVWTKDPGKRHDDGEIAVCGTLYEEKLMIFSRDSLKVMAALDVLDGKKPGLKKGSRLGAKTPKGCTLVMRGIDLHETARDMRCPVLKDSKWFELTTGAYHAKAFVNLTVKTISDKVAQDAVDVTKGLLALVNLKHGHDKSVKTLLDGVKIEADQTNLSLHWSADEKETMELVDKIGSHMRKRRAQRHHADHAEKH